MKKYLFIALVATLLTGCGGGGSSSNTQSNINSTTGFKLISNDIQANSAIERDLTQYGINESPHLTWSKIPSNTKSFAFIMDDISLTAAVIHWNFFTNNTNIVYVMRDASGTTAMPTDIIERSNYLGDNKYEGWSISSTRRKAHLSILYLCA